MYHLFKPAFQTNLALISILFAGIPLNTVLEVFGEYFVQYCFRHGYDQLLRTLGKDFISFIQNLDALHANLQRTYTKLRPPSFRFVVFVIKLKYWSHQPVIIRPQRRLV